MGDSMIYCCATNYHKILGLRQHIYHLPVSLGQQSRHCLPESSAQGLTGHQATSQAVFHPGALRCPSKLTQLFAEFHSPELQEGGTIFFLAVSWGHSQLLKAAHQWFPHDHHLPKHAHSHLQSLQEMLGSSLLKESLTYYDNHVGACTRARQNAGHLRMHLSLGTIFIRNQFVSENLTL